MSDLRQAAIRALSAQPRREILPLEYEGKRYWIKRGREGGSPLLQRLLWPLGHFPLLLPSLPMTPKESVAHESSRIRALADLGIPVPTLVLVEKEYFVMEDVGRPLRRILRKDPKHPELVSDALRLLARLHGAGEYHGGAQLRNITLKDDRLYFIDFEEKFEVEEDRALLQARDLFLFFHCLHKHRIPYEPGRYLELYREAGGAESSIRRFEALLDSLAWLRRLPIPAFLRTRLDKDSRALLELLEAMSSAGSQKAGG